MYELDIVMEEGELGVGFPGGRPKDKILYDLLVCCKWPEVATGLVSLLTKFIYDSCK